MHCDAGLYEAAEGCDRKNFKDRYSERCGKRNVPDWKTSGVESDRDVWNCGNRGECGCKQCGGICQYSGDCDRTCDRDGHWQMHRSRGKRTGEILQQAPAWPGLCGNDAGGSGTVCTRKTNHRLLRVIGGSGTDCHTASGKFRNLRGADLAAQFYSSECAARRRGCKVYDGSQRFFHVGFPRGKQLLFCRNDGAWRARCLDRHVCGLGVPHAAFRDPLPAREVAGKARGMMPQGN